MARGRVLIAAGSDSGGGAGIQADTKTVTALGGFAATAITALTAQNTRGVFGVVGVDPAFIRLQMEVVLDDIGADCVKTGMLHDAAVIEAVAAVLDERAPAVPLVVDPVMVAKGGEALLEPAAVKTLKERLLPRATLVTPNLLEAEALTGMTLSDTSGMEEAGKMIRAMGPQAVLVKGGHLAGTPLVDVLVTASVVHRFSGERINTRHTHGTGCTLASAIATGIAQSMPLHEAVARAREYLIEAILTAPAIGSGHGPVNHGHTMRMERR